MSRSLRVLVVEDEMIVTMLLEDLLAELGHTVTATAAHLDDSVRLAEAGGFDLAMLDLNINGQQSFPVAQALRARGVPFVFATGYGEAGLPEAWRGTPTLQKPFMAEDLEAVLARMAASG